MRRVALRISTMNNSLFAPSPRRKRGLTLTLSGSLLFHGSLVGIAAFWPTHPTEKPPVITIIGIGDLPVSGNEPLPAAPPPPSEPDPAPPVLKASEPVDNLPPTFEPGADDMTLATPVPHPAMRTPAHPTSASATTRATRRQSSVSVSGPANGPAGSPGSDRPGLGMRWNTPEPPYPAALRLARVRGNGVVRVTTDGSGRVIGTAIVRSTGNALLDDNTCRAARNDWSGPPNATVQVPITYQLQ